MMKPVFTQVMANSEVWCRRSGFTARHFSLWLVRFVRLESLTFGNGWENWELLKNESVDDNLPSRCRI